MTTTLTGIPASVEAGTSVSYQRSYTDYPADGGWTLTAYLSGPSAASKVATASGKDFVVAWLAVDTSALSPGVYQYVERVSDGTNVYRVFAAFVNILPDIAAAAAGDLQSWEEKTLAVVEAAIAGRLTKDQETYSIAGRSVVRIPITELLKLRDQLRSAVYRQRNPGTFDRPVRVEFPFTGQERL